jgi:hypothetical protein
MKIKIGVQCLDVGAEASQTDYCVVVHGKHLLKVCVQSHCLDAESSVCCDGNTVFTDHGHTGTAII